jgi:hypothetical protein
MSGGIDLPPVLHFPFFFVQRYHYQVPHWVLCAFAFEAFRKRLQYRDSVGIRCAASCRKGTGGRIRLRGETSLASSVRNVGDAGDGAEIMANAAFSACPKGITIQPM